MKRSLLLLTLLVLLPSLARAELCAGWRTSDTLLLASALTLTEVDREQTQWMLSHGDYERYNWFMAGHPSATVIDRTFLLETVSAIVASCLLPNPYRDLLYIGWTGLEISDTAHNAKSVGAPISLLGINLSF